jgi:hypothetical protein
MMTDAVTMRMLTPFQIGLFRLRFQFGQKNALSTKFGWRLILMWPFDETNAAAVCTAKTAGLCRRVSLMEPWRRLAVQWFPG